MSISHPRLRSFSLKASLRTPAALAAWVGMVHYISTSKTLPKAPLFLIYPL
jgi:hypothetical protein